MKERFWGFHLDFLGFVTSFVCAVHCAAIPFILTLSVFGGLSWISDPLVESGFLVASLSIAAFTLFQGYRKHTIDKTGLILFISGFSFLIFSRLLPHSHGIELLFAIAGGLTIAGAHIYHWISLKSTGVELSK